MPNTTERWRNFGDVLILPVKYSIGSAAITSATWISLRIALKWIRINAESHITGMQSVYVLRSPQLGSFPVKNYSKEPFRGVA